MFLSRDNLLPSSPDWMGRYEKVHKNLAKRTRQLKRANQELANQIAERKRVEEALQQAERKYRSIFENAVEGIFQTTPDGRYQACNPALARIYGYDSPTQLLTSLVDIAQQLYVDPRRRDEFIEQLHYCDSVSEFESQIYRRDGSIIWISENARAVRDDDGTLLYYEGFVTDITQRKLAEEHLRQSEARSRVQAEQLEVALNQLQQTQVRLIQNERLSTLGQLVAGVAHEINNPVNFVCGNLIPASQYAEDLIKLLELYTKYYPQPVPEIQQQAEAIELDFLIEDFPRTLSSMQLGADRIRQIVQSLRNFSRFDEAQMKPVDIHEGLNSTLLILQNRLKSKKDNWEIVIVKEYGELPSVECYAGLLNQVFMNLLCNAIDALDDWHLESLNLEGSNQQPETPYIRICTEVICGNSPDNSGSDLQAVIRIINNGPGMTQEVRSRIFDPFFTTKPLGKGTGLGLSISYQIIVEKHGGQLKCISTPEQGTEFVIKIPIKQ
jgi:PAS domain S-box-containing protein